MKRIVIFAVVLLSIAGCDGAGRTGARRRRSGTAPPAGSWSTMDRPGRTRPGGKSTSSPRPPTTGDTQTSVPVQTSFSSTKILMVQGSAMFGEHVARILPAGAACFLRIGGVDKSLEGAGSLEADADASATFADAVCALAAASNPSQRMSALAGYLSSVTGGRAEKLAGLVANVREIHAAFYDTHMSRFKSVVILAFGSDEQAYGVLVASEKSLRRAGQENNTPFYRKQPPRPSQFRGPTIMPGVGGPSGPGVPPPGAPPPGMFMDMSGGPPPGYAITIPTAKSTQKKQVKKFTERVVTQVGNFIIAGEARMVQSILKVTPNPLSDDPVYRAAKAVAGDAPVFGFANGRKLTRLLLKMGPHVPGAVALVQNMALPDAPIIILTGALGDRLTVRAPGSGALLAGQLLPDGAQWDWPVLRLVPRGGTYCVWFEIADVAGSISDLATLASKNLGGADAPGALLKALADAGAAKLLYPVMTGRVVAFLPRGCAMGAGDERGGVIFGLEPGEDKAKQVSKCLLGLSAQRRAEERPKQRRTQAITTFLEPLPISWTVGDGYLALSFDTATVTAVVEAAESGVPDLIGGLADEARPDSATFLSVTRPSSLLGTAAMARAYAPRAVEFMPPGPVVIAGTIDGDDLVITPSSPAGAFALLAGGPPGVAAAMVSPVGCEAHLHKLRNALAAFAKRNRGYYPRSLEALVGERFGILEQDLVCPVVGERPVQSYGAITTGGPTTPVRPGSRTPGPSRSVAASGYYKFGVSGARSNRVRPDTIVILDSIPHPDGLYYGITEVGDIRKLNKRSFEALFRQGRR